MIDGTVLIGGVCKGGVLSLLYSQHFELFDIFYLRETRPLRWTLVDRLSSAYSTESMET